MFRRFLYVISAPFIVIIMALLVLLALPLEGIRYILIGEFRNGDSYMDKWPIIIEELHDKVKGTS